jgi:hypothetical protein
VLYTGRPSYQLPLAPSPEEWPPEKPESLAELVDDVEDEDEKTPRVEVVPTGRWSCGVERV